MLHSTCNNAMSIVNTRKACKECNGKSVFKNNLGREDNNFCTEKSSDFSVKISFIRFFCSEKSDEAAQL